MEAVKLWEDGLWAVSMALQLGGCLLGEGIGLVSLVSRVLLEQLVGEEELAVSWTLTSSLAWTKDSGKAASTGTAKSCASFLSAQGQQDTHIIWGHLC